MHGIIKSYMNTFLEYKQDEQIFMCDHELLVNAVSHSTLQMMFKQQFDMTSRRITRLSEKEIQSHLNVYLSPLSLWSWVITCFRKPGVDKTHKTALESATPFPTFCLRERSFFGFCFHKKTLLMWTSHGILIIF